MRQNRAFIAFTRYFTVIWGFYTFFLYLSPCLWYLTLVHTICSYCHCIFFLSRKHASTAQAPVHVTTSVLAHTVVVNDLLRRATCDLRMKSWMCSTQGSEPVSLSRLLFQRRHCVTVLVDRSRLACHGSLSLLGCIVVSALSLVRAPHWAPLLIVLANFQSMNTHFTSGYIHGVSYAGKEILNSICIS